MEMENKITSSVKDTGPFKPDCKRPRRYRIYLTDKEADQLMLVAQEHRTTPKSFIEALIHIVLRDKLVAAIIDGEHMAAN